MPGKTVFATLALPLLVFVLTASRVALSAPLVPTSVPMESCESYEIYIEPKLPCGLDGFTLSYGALRCQAIEQLRESGSVSSWISAWLLEHETCMQEELIQLAASHASVDPDPPMCLQFELEAFAAVERCFVRNISLFCDSEELANAPDILANQLKVVFENLTISDYYKHKVTSTVSAAVRTCSHPNVVQVMSSIEQIIPQDIVVICAVVSGNDAPVSSDPVESYYPETIASLLQKPVEQFAYGGRHMADVKCREKAPVPLSRTSNYHYVLWKPQPVESLPVMEIEENQALSLVSFFDCFELLRLNSSSCGDGLRQAGELCDTGVSSLVDGAALGCDRSCMPQLGYECDAQTEIHSTCEMRICGNGKRTSDEECDDGNEVPGDGCSNCTIEDRFVCTGRYNQLTVCTAEVTTASPDPSTTTAAPLPEFTSSSDIDLKGSVSVQTITSTSAASTVLVTTTSPTPSPPITDAPATATTRGPTTNTPPTTNTDRGDMRSPDSSSMLHCSLISVLLLLVLSKLFTYDS